MLLKKAASAREPLNVVKGRVYRMFIVRDNVRGRKTGYADGRTRSDGRTWKVRMELDEDGKKEFVENVQARNGAWLFVAIGDISVTRGSRSSKVRELQ